MLELYWLKAMVAIFEVLAVEAGFVAEAQWRRRQLGIRAAHGQTNKCGNRGHFCFFFGGGGDRHVPFSGFLHHVSGRRFLLQHSCRL